MSVLLDQRPSLLTLRRRFPAFVRMTHRYCSAVRLLRDVPAGRAAIAFSRRPVVCVTSGTSEVSRFSCMEFPDVRGVPRLRRASQKLACRFWPCCLPLQMTASAPRLQLFEARYPARLCPCLRFTEHFT